MNDPADNRTAQRRNPMSGRPMADQLRTPLRLIDEALEHIHEAHFIRQIARDDKPEKFANAEQDAREQEGLALVKSLAAIAAAILG